MFFICIYHSPLNYIDSLAIKIMISVLVLLFLGIGCNVLVQNIDYIYHIQSKLFDYVCYYILLFVHILFCIKINNSSSLTNFIDAKYSKKLFLLQLLAHLIQLSCIIALFIDIAFNSIIIEITLGLSGIEAIIIGSILVRKLKNM